MRPYLPSFVALLVLACSSAHAFQFEHTPPTECGDVTVRWSGGSPPFRLLIIPPRGTLRNLSIPDSNYVGDSGTFTTQMQFNTGSSLLLAMSDSTGTTAGGISRPLTVGAAPAGASCNTTDPGVDFFYQLNSELRQCADYPFSAYDGAVQPITVFGFTPGGDSFQVQAPRGDTFNWKADLAAGTAVIFYVTDANGRNGGCSNIYQVGASSDTTCLRAATPSSSSGTSTSGTSRTSGAPRPSGKPDDDDDNDSDGQDGDGKKEGGSKIGVIVGAAAGGFVFLCALAFLYVFCFKRKKTGTTTSPVSLDSDYKPPPQLGGGGLPASPSNTYLLPSSINNNSTTNLAPSQSAAPYAQDTYASTQTGTSTASGMLQSQQEEYNPYSQGGGYGGYSDQGSAYSPGAPTSVAAGVAAGASSAGAASYAYNNYNQYQQQGQQQYDQDPRRYQQGQQGYQQGHYQEYPQDNLQYHHGQQYPQQGQQYGQYGQHYPQQPQHYPQQGQYYQQQQQQGYQAAPSHTGTSRSQGTFYTTNADSDTYNSQHSSYPPQPQSSSDSKNKPPTSAAPARVVVHQDIDDSMDLPDELPPSYSESRAPIPGLPNASSNPPLRDRKR